MKYALFFLFIIVYMFLNKSKDSYEGFTTCDYREKKRTGTMCGEKWGEPECKKWEKKEKLTKIEDRKTLNILKGHYSNPYMYEIDYEEYGNIEGEDDNNDKNVPRGVHSSFFS
jgi:hypothetical protein